LTAEPIKEGLEKTRRFSTKSAALYSLKNKILTMKFAVMFTVTFLLLVQNSFCQKKGTTKNGFHEYQLKPEEEPPLRLDDNRYIYGTKEYMKFLKQNLVIPKIFREQHTQYNSTITVYIDSLGYPYKYIPEKGSCRECDSDALEVIKKINKWLTFKTSTPGANPNRFFWVNVLFPPEWDIAEVKTDYGLRYYDRKEWEEWNAKPKEAKNNQYDIRMCLFQKKYKADSVFYFFNTQILDGSNDIIVSNKPSNDDDCGSAIFWRRIFNKVASRGNIFDMAIQFTHSSVMVNNAPALYFGLNEFLFKNDSLSLVAYNKMHQCGRMPIEAAESYCIVRNKNRLLIITYNSHKEKEIKKILYYIETSYNSFIADNGE
jgi:hypothetical protein